MTMASVMPGIYIDAKPDRQMPAGLAIVRRLAATGRLRPVVVIGLGTNYIVTTKQLNELMNVLGPYRKLVLINTYVPDAWSRQVNATEAAFIRQHPSVTPADWFDTIRNRMNLLWPDHIHPEIPGTYVYARMVRRRSRPPRRRCSMSRARSGGRPPRRVRSVTAARLGGDGDVAAVVAGRDHTRRSVTAGGHGRRRTGSGSRRVGRGPRRQHQGDVAEVSVTVTCLGTLVNVSDVAGIIAATTSAAPARHRDGLAVREPVSQRYRPPGCRRVVVQPELLARAGGGDGAEGAY